MDISGAGGDNIAPQAFKPERKRKETRAKSPKSRTETESLKKE